MIARSSWLVVLAVACKGGAKSEAPPIASGSSISGSSIADAIAAPVAVDAPPSERCMTACLYLKDTPLEQAREAFAKECGKPWPVSDEDCEGLLYARNCIYAAYGNVFKRPEWKQKFEGQPWYRANPHFNERDFSAVAKANVKALVAASKACGVPPISKADKQLAETWFEKLRTGSVESEHVNVDTFQKTYEMYALHDATKLEYVEKPTAQRKEIAITGLEYMAGPGKLDPDMSVVLVFDGNDQVIDFR